MNKLSRGEKKSLDRGRGGAGGREHAAVRFDEGDEPVHV